MEDFTDENVLVTSWDVIRVELEPELSLVRQLDVLQGLIILAKVAGLNTLKCSSVFVSINKQIVNL